MTTTEQAVEEESWRGVAAEDNEELTNAVGLRLQARSRALLRSLLRPRLGMCLLAFALVVAENIVTLSGPLLVAEAIDVGIPAAIDGRTTVLTWCVAGYLATAIGSGLLRYLFVRVVATVGQDLLLDLRGRVFRHAQGLSLSFHEKYTSGKVISRLTSDLESIEDLLDIGLDGLLTAALSVVGIAILMLTLDLPLALFVLAGFVPLLLVTRWFYRTSNRAYRDTRGGIAKIIVQFVESMNGMRAVQAFRRQERNETIMSGLNGRFRDANQRALVVLAKYTMIVRLVGNLSLAAVLAIGAVRVVNGGLELGVLTAFLLYLRRFYDPLDEVAMFANAYSAANAALEKISGLLEERPDVAEPAEPKPLPAAADGREVRFERVEFRYSADGPVVLPEFDLTIPAGQTVALVGETGAGKSTIAKLVARFYDPTKGDVLLSGVPLRSVADEDLRRSVVMVTQENFLFSGSVADNIGLGRLGASRAEIEAAAEAVGAAEFVEKLPEGYDTDVRKRGGRLSAGQRQLVAFARAFLADPSVLVLDEATASLDVPSERAVQRALETVLADRTALIIAHRLSTVLIADRVLVVDGGRIVEDGSPQSLVDQGSGQFADLHNAWLASLA
ncbi:ABC transporter ATP-binding protein [Labedaea rhizosphaerae]|uniref:ABC-type multidrug transport system fused ATPase/permease subunit n=1 Tax=Labedaea rhizosphaerae TaxID=598644 RepID=A0A4R6SMH1_LABRH|nr:ABC transporter ATP-binding protein [Labedaea rhizosphaerae]TDQ04522.1 ABC-type multidrug transport system fused ATPase/permease subunit [Labedaea rhizosphaerae]